MKTMILAAGKGKRFAAEGWYKPKLMLPMPDDRVLLEWMLDGYAIKDGVLVMREEDYPQLKRIVQRTAFRSVGDTSETKPDKFGVSFVADSEGPLDTLHKARGWLHSAEPILLVYSDIVPLCPLDVIEELASPNSDNADARMIVFESDNERFTDARDMVGFKQSGIYWFRNARQVRNATRYLRRGKNNGIPDLWSVYDGDKRREVPWRNSWLADLGTPQDYRNWMAKQGTPVYKDWSKKR